VEIPLIGELHVYNDGGVEEVKEVIVKPLEAQTRWDTRGPVNMRDPGCV
jgi:hypothetical protein